MTSDPQTGDAGVSPGDIEVADTGAVSVFDDIDAYFRDAPARAFGDRPSRSAIESDFFTLDPLEQHEVTAQYWVNKPFAYTTVLFDESEDKYRYRFFEPQLSDFERYVRRDLEQTIRHVLRERPPGEFDDSEAFESTLEDLVAKHAATVDDASLHKIFYYLVRDFIGYGRLDPLMHDGKIEDISCDGSNVPVFVYHQTYQDLETNLLFTKPDLDSFVLSLAQRSDKHISASQPQASATLPDGSRIHLTLDSDISMRGSNFTIRKFDESQITPPQLVDFGTFSLREMAYLWLALEHNMSIMFVGPTASGKTTSMNAVSLFLPPDGKVVSIEQLREIYIPHDNWVSYVTREARANEGRDEISMYDLLQSALHERPEYILVGEIRTDPTVSRTFFQSVFTGHPGATTFHASTAQNAINRLTSEPLDITEQMASALDLIAVQKQVSIDGQGTGPRRNMSLSEVRTPDSGDETINIVELFRWDAQTDTIEEQLDFMQNSRVLQSIAEVKGWEIERVLDEIDKREEVLAYMIDHDITDHDRVVATTARFYRNQARVLEQVRNETFEPPALEPSELP
jgi:flagellar protein FlaI